MTDETPVYQIMLVDDDTFLLDMYALKFKERGTKVEACITAKQALQKISEGFKPDLLLIDVVMPEMNGFELLEELKKNDSIHPVVVVLSNQGQDQDIEQAKKLGAHGYIIKANAMPSEVVDQSFEILKKHAPSA